MAGLSVVVGVATRPHPAERLNGDAVVVMRDEVTCRIAVVDGLGHGWKAHASAVAAREVLEGHEGVGSEALLRQTHRALRAMRGAAVSIATIDLAERRLVFTGVGNVDARLYDGGRSHSLLPNRGIVGSRLPTIRPLDRALGDDWVLVVTSDGIGSRYDLDLPRRWEPEEADRMAGEILAGWARASDDASVAVAFATR